MTLMNVYRPGSLFNLLNEEMNRAFQMVSGQDDVTANAGDWMPAVDISEDDKAYTILADVPGVKPEDVDVELENGVLTIKGERETVKEDEKEGYKRVERISGKFYRRFTLPETVDEENISAKTENGVLKIIIPKKPKPEPKRIQVQS